MHGINIFGLGSEIINYDNGNGYSLPDVIQPSVYFGTVNDPNVTSPTTETLIKADTYIQTLDGTETGILLSEWRYTGTTWVRINYKNYPTSFPAVTPNRVYFPNNSAMMLQINNPIDAAAVAAMGFTAKGSATCEPYSGDGGPYGGHYMIRCANLDTPPANDTQRYSIPVNYVEHEIPVTSGVDNMYFLSTLTNRSSFVNIEVWICDSSGTPLSRLHSSSQCRQDADTKDHMCIGPDNGHTLVSQYYEFSSWCVPESLVTANITGSNTIKLAIRPASNSQDGTILFLGGYAMTTNPFGVSQITVVNLIWNSDWDNSSRLTWQGTLGGLDAGYVPENSSRKVRIPLIDNTHDIIVTMIGTDTNLGGNGLQWTISHPSGDVQLGRPNVTNVSPYAYGISRVAPKLHYYSVSIDAVTLAAKTITPTNSGIPYLELDLINIFRGTNWRAYVHGFFVERS